MKIYKNRYQAGKEKSNNEVIVKVDGGYTIIGAEEYRIWKKQI